MSPNGTATGQRCDRSNFRANMWQRPMYEALQVTERIKDLLGEYPS